jgi:hypothetical protein
MRGIETNGIESGFEEGFCTCTWKVGRVKRGMKKNYFFCKIYVENGTTFSCRYGVRLCIFELPPHINL